MSAPISIADILAAHLEPLAARLRRPAIAALATRLARAGGERGLVSLIVAAPRAVAGLRDEHADVLRRLAAVEDEVHAEQTAAGQLNALARAIRREVKDPRRRRGDLRALHRGLDLAALRERFAGELDSLETQVELALAFVGRAAAAVLASEPTAGPPLRRAALPQFLLAQLTWRPRFTLRLAATEALQRVCDALGPADPDGEIAAATVARVTDPDEHPWVMAAALKVLCSVAPADGLRLCGEVLRTLHAAAPTELSEGTCDDPELARAGSPIADEPSVSLRIDLGDLAGTSASGGASVSGASISGQASTSASELPAPEPPPLRADPASLGIPSVHGALSASIFDAGVPEPPSAPDPDRERLAAPTAPTGSDDLDAAPRPVDDSISLRVDLGELGVSGLTPVPERSRLPPGPFDFGPRAFLLRRLVVDWLMTRTDARHGPAIVDLLAESVAAPDPSEHVRIGLCRAAAALLHEPRGPAMLTRLADPASEPSPAVRASALRAAVGGPAAVDLLRRSLSEETSPLVLRVACLEAGRQGGPELTAALTTLVARDDRPAAVHEAAAAALEAIDRAHDPVRAAWTAALAGALARTRPGGTTSVPLHPGDLPPPGDARWLGRIFAELTRDDWGVDVDVGETRLTIRRGDRWRARLWRVLHELRSPSPNKRQAHSHTRGRLLRGDLRAHSGRLHEVTDTGVPGERVQVEREGGWGRHLPLVDDLLGLPVLRARPVQVVSSHGTCTISWDRGLLGRIRGRAALVARYAALAALRQECLAAHELGQRGRYVQALRGLGVDLRFTAHPPPRLALGTGELHPGHHAVTAPGTAGETTDDSVPGASRPLPAQLRALFPGESHPLQLPPDGEPRQLAAAVLLAPDLLDWLWLHAPYFISISANSQQALAYFLAGLVAVGLVAAYLRNRGMARDRAAIPLVIGGWGTRGKSGTERLKAGLLHGLGYRVFSKTTGCEAMFIHAPPLGPAREIYSFRPYGKATIWEQRTLLGIAAGLHTEVFLWECMALSPAYVQILQHSWMRDDLSTITNAYPDHEDIQGPAGMDVAEVISGFVPARSTLVTSEINFLPIMRRAAERRGTRVAEVGDLEGELLPRDLLALFPYDEHPRNVALVARVAVELGLDPTLAIVTMAEHVVPDLGVLKRFGPARVRGRQLEFINGCSANERTGFLSNWRRTGCDALDLAAEPDRYIITVVNNRDDRVSRSQVFARVLVEDVAVDRHVIIGTNTQGLLGYVRGSLDDFLARQVIVGAEDLSPGTDVPALAGRRLEALLARLRIVPGEPDALAHQLEIFARGAARALPAATREEAARRVEPLLAADPSASLELAATIAAVHAALADWTLAAVEAAPAARLAGPPEVDVPADATSIAAHFVRQVARTAIACRLRARLSAALAAGPGALDEFHAQLRGAYRGLFMELIDIVEDPLSTGDETVLRCALAVPPGVRVALMGTQNIKGTGLDFVYRWIALDAAEQNLAALRSGDPNVRHAALQRLEHPDDPGLLDAGLVAAVLATRTADPDEQELQTRAQARAAALHAARRAALGHRAQRGRVDAVLGWLEGWVDFIDGARRFSRAKQVMRDLVDQRISHAGAAQIMRELDARAKGGWLVKSLRRKR